MTNVITLNNFAVNNSSLTGINWPELTDKTDFHAVLSPVYDKVIIDPLGPKSLSTVYSSALPDIEYQEDTLGRFVKRTDNGRNLGIVGSTYGIADNAPLYDMIKEWAETALPREALRDIKLTERSSFGGQFTPY